MTQIDPRLVPAEIFTLRLFLHFLRFHTGKKMDSWITVVGRKAVSHLALAMLLG